MKIGNRNIGPGHCGYVIAEAGTGHAHALSWQRPHRACELADAANNAGADAVKFQLFVPDEPLFCPLAGDEKRWERWNDTLMGFQDWEQVVEHCRDIDITFLASAFQPTAVEWLKQLRVPAYKVASRAAKTYPYSSTPGPWLISNGMHKAIWSNDNSMVLQCASKYPTPLAEAGWEGGDDEGLSDHSGSPWPAIDALARGCPLVEVHFTLGNAGPDEESALTTDELELVCGARDAFAEMKGLEP